MHGVSTNAVGSYFKHVFFIFFLNLVLYTDYSFFCGAEFYIIPPIYAPRMPFAFTGHS